MSTTFEQIQALCKDFRRQLRGGADKRIEDYLDRVYEDSRKMLFQNLLHIDIEFQRRKGHEPVSDDYVKRFPQHAKLVRQAFFESTQLSMNPEVKTPADEDTVLFGMPAARKLGDYELLRELGRGGFGVVYEARHLERGDVVALKTLPSVPEGQQQDSGEAERLHKFRREFRSLCEINHPHLVGMQTLEVDGSQWFFTMDVIDGTDFLGYVRPRGILDEARLRPALGQLAAGILALHEQGIAHRDLKPGNVLVSSDGHVTILDFGLVAELQQRTDQTMSMHSQQFAGTPRYAAPEQIMGDRTMASDWYALGTMLYEAFTGEAPFKGSTVQIMLRKQNEDAPVLAENPNYARDLTQLTDQLLQKNPEQRPDIGTICEVLGIKPASVSHDSTDSSLIASGSQSAEVLIGREVQLAQLNEARRESLKNANPAVVFISGRSGEGKTSLAEKFLSPLRADRESLVLSGRCYERESVPFKAIDGVIDALVALLRKKSTEDVLSLLPDDVPMLAQLFPVLLRVPAIADRAVAGIATADDRQIRIRAFAALGEILSRLSQSTSVTLFIDDLHWGDRDSAAVLFALLSSPDPPNVLFLGSFRSDEASESPFLQEWNTHGKEQTLAFMEQHVCVEPLTASQSVELVAARLGIDASGVLEQAGGLFAEARGNPYFLEHLTEGFNAESGQFQPLPLHEIIDRRLKRLPDAAATLLEVISTAETAMPVEEAFRVAGHEKPAFGTITHMCSERLVRLLGSTHQRMIDTYHDRIRETILANLPDDVRRSHHASHARAIETNDEPLSDQELDAIRAGQLPDRSPPRVFDLAYHFSRTDDRERTFAYALLAARQARRQLALDRVLKHFDVARRVGGSLSAKVLFHIVIHRGEALVLLARYREALVDFATATDVADNDFDRARIESLKGQTHHRNGDVKECIACVQSGLNSLGFRVPGSVPGLTVGLVREVAIQTGHTLFPKRLHRKPWSAQAQLVIQLFNWLSQQTIFQNTLTLLYAQLAAINHAERFPRSAELVLSSAWHGMMMTMLGWHKRGGTYLQRGMDQAIHLDDIWLTSFAEVTAGIGYFGSARFRDALVFVEKSIAHIGESGDPYVLGFARFHRGCSHYMLGDLTKALADAKETFETAAQVGDSRTMCASWLWARVTSGNLPFEDLRKRIPHRPDDVMSTVHVTMAEGLYHSRHGRHQKSLECFQAAAARVRQTLCINSHTILVMPMLARALRLRANDLQETDPQQCHNLRRRSLRIAGRAAWVSRLFPNARPLMLRELSEIQRATGRLRSAFKQADRSCRVAERQEAVYELAQSRLLRAKLAVQLKLPGANQQIQAAQAEWERFDDILRKAGDAC